jgi:hypothetical protein
LICLLCQTTIDSVNATSSPKPCECTNPCEVATFSRSSSIGVLANVDQYSKDRDILEMFKTGTDIAYHVDENAMQQITQLALEVGTVCFYTYILQ